MISTSSSPNLSADRRLAAVRHLPKNAPPILVPSSPLEFCCCLRLDHQPPASPQSSPLDHPCHLTRDPLAALCQQGAHEEAQRRCRRVEAHLDDGGGHGIVLPRIHLFSQEREQELGFVPMMCDFKCFAPGVLLEFKLHSNSNLYKAATSTRALGSSENK